MRMNVAQRGSQFIEVASTSRIKLAHETCAVSSGHSHMNAGDGVVTSDVGGQKLAPGRCLFCVAFGQSGSWVNALAAGRWCRHSSRIALTERQAESGM